MRSSRPAASHERLRADADRGMSTPASTSWPIAAEVVPRFVEVEVMVPRLAPAMR